MSSTRIALFGGAFDPPHIAHVEMVRYARSIAQLSLILVVPTFKHPFSKNMAAFSDRFEMCKIAFEGEANLIVSDIERTLGKVSYTADTLREMKKIYPDADWSLILGSDAFEQFSNWKDADYIQRTCELIVVPRGPKSPVADLSSTSAREVAKSGGQFKNMLPDKVAQYIKDHNLY